VGAIDASGRMDFDKGGAIHQTKLCFKSINFGITSKL